MKKLFIILLSFLIITGCDSKENEVSKNENFTLYNNEKTVLIDTNTKVLDKEIKLDVAVTENDYSKLDNNINKSVAYDITLLKNSEKVTITNEVEVSLLIPEEYNENNLIVYYIKDNKIEETFNVTVIEKDKQKYANFKTNHFSIYVLAELKDKESKVENKKEEVKETNKNEVKPSTNNSNNTVNNNITNSAPAKTINLVGTWKYDDGTSLTYYIFKSDGTGQMINKMSFSNEYVFWDIYYWGLNGNNITIQSSNSMASVTNRPITIIDDNNISFDVAKQLNYTRYYGEVPVKTTTYEGSINVRVEIKNISEGLKSSGSHSVGATFTTTDKSIYDTAINTTYNAYVDASSCLANTPCNVTVNYMDLPTNATIRKVDVISITLITNE